VEYFLWSRSPRRPQQELESLWTGSTSPAILEADPSSNVYPLRLTSWKCRKCPYGSPQLAMNQPTLYPRHSLNPLTCGLDGLTDDSMYELSHRMTSKSLTSFCRAYPRFRAITDAHRVLLRHARSLSSDFAWLSMETFDNHRVRSSIEKRHFEYFLPLAFSPANFNASSSFPRYERPSRSSIKNYAGLTRLRPRLKNAHVAGRIDAPDRYLLQGLITLSMCCTA
jgi:hypothetical protein